MDQTIKIMPCLDMQNGRVSRCGYVGDMDFATLELG